MYYPDTQEGVAFGLTKMIFGNPDLATSSNPIPEEEVLRVFRRCLEAVIGRFPRLEAGGTSTTH